MTRDRADGTLPMEFGRLSSSTARCMRHSKRVLEGMSSQLQRKRIALAMDGSSARCKKRRRRGSGSVRQSRCCGNGGAAALACACLEPASLIGAHRHGVSAEVGFEQSSVGLQSTAPECCRGPFAHMSTTCGPYCALWRIFSGARGKRYKDEPRVRDLYSP